MSDEMSFEELTALVPGTIGPPGRRIFYIQAIHDGSLLSLKCEKAHVAALMEYLGECLVDQSPPDRTSAAHGIEFSEPASVLWTIGSLGVGHDEANERFVVMAHEFTEDGDGGSVRIHLTVDQADAFIARANQLMVSGRPPCPFCDEPMEPEGHACPRMN